MESLNSSTMPELAEPNRVAIINLNYSESIFKEIFSKMEFIIAWEFLEEKVKKYSIPMLYTHLVEKDGAKSQFASYLHKKEKTRAEHTAPKSPLDADFIRKFQAYLPSVSDQISNVPHEDIFLESDVEKWIRDSGRDTIMFTGFYTERDVFVSAFEALMRKYYSVIISDATSTYSERIFFTSLDLISQNVEVIDTRDLEKIW